MSCTISKYKVSRRVTILFLCFILRTDFFNLNFFKGLDFCFVSM